MRSADCQVLVNLVAIALELFHLTGGWGDPLDVEQIKDAWRVYCELLWPVKRPTALTVLTCDRMESERVRKGLPTMPGVTASPRYQASFIFLSPV